MLESHKFKGFFGLSGRGERSLAERRTVERESTSRGAYVISQNGTMPCEILDISEKGARIRLDDTAGLPKFFELHTPEGEAFLCELKRRKSDHVGVQFLRHA